MFDDQAKLKALERELAMRRTVYPRQVSQGKMTSEKAAKEIQILRKSQMTIAEKSAPACSQLGDQEVTLLDQMNWVAFGYASYDVALAAMTILVQAAVINSENGQQAAAKIQALCAHVTDDIMQHFDEIRLDNKLHGQQH